MDSLIKKLAGYIPVNIAGILGIVQALVKFTKEVLTAAVNILFPVFPNAVFHKTVDVLRTVLNNVDNGIQVVKDWLLKFGVTKA